MGPSPTDPAGEEPPSGGDEVRPDFDPDSPGAAISDEDGPPPAEVPEPNEPG